MDIKRNVNEVNESYNRRVWFIKQMNPKTSNEKLEAIQLSQIWVNTILLHCIYPIDAMTKIKKVLGASKYNKKLL